MSVARVCWGAINVETIDFNDPDLNFFSLARLVKNDFLFFTLILSCFVVQKCNDVANFQEQTTIKIIPLTTIIQSPYYSLIMFTSLIYLYMPKSISPVCITAEYLETNILVL